MTALGWGSLTADLIGVGWTWWFFHDRLQHRLAHNHGQADDGQETAR